MTTLYRATTCGSIEKIEAIRTTDTSYFSLDFRRKERCNALEGNSFKVFNTEQQAIAWMREHLEKMITEARDTLAYRITELNAFSKKYPQP